MQTLYKLLEYWEEQEKKKCLAFESSYAGREHATDNVTPDGAERERESRPR